MASQNVTATSKRDLIGYAYCKLIFTENGEPVDFEFIQVNQAFEHFTGLSAKKVIGQRMQSFFTNLEAEKHDWMNYLSALAAQGFCRELDHFSEPLQRYIRIIEFSPAKDDLIAVFTEIPDIEQRLNIAEQKNDLIVQNMNDIIWTIDINLRLTYVSPSVKSSLGYTVGEAMQYSLDQLMTGPSQQHLFSIFQKALANDDPQKTDPDHVGKHEFEIVGKDGSTIWMECLIRQLRDRQNKLIGFIGLSRDISESRKYKEALSESEKIISVLISHLPVIAFRCRCDKERSVLYLSDGCSALTGFKPEQLCSNMTNSYGIMVDASYREIVRKAQEKAIKKKSEYSVEYPIRTAAGEMRWVLEQGRANSEDANHNQILEGIVIDITERKKHEEEMLYLFRHDSLTGIYNRKSFYEELARLDCADQLPLSVIVGDINGLRLINEAFGYEKGDELIVQTAKMIKEFCREQDLLARTSGDEFSLILPRTDNQTAYEIMLDIKQKFSEYNDLQPIDGFVISMALGYNTKTNETEDINAIMRAAVEYMAKHKLLEIKSSHSAIISSIKATMFESSQETEQHAERIAEMAKEIGNRLNLPQVELDELVLLATLHDLGKIGVAGSIVFKPDKLNDDEWREMRRHPEIGYRIARSSPEFFPVAEYILCHHERWDGKGYPQGIAGEEIPLLSRIISVVDAFDAMTQMRPYRDALPRETAINEIRTNAGTQFDPSIAEIFLEMLKSNPEQ